MAKDNNPKYFKDVNPQENFPELEKKWLKTWSEQKIVEKYLTKNNQSSEKFSFLDGPITANNPMGVHHAWGRTYKDFWQRYWNMKGKKERFQNGFDEQGLWVEVEVEKELGLKSKKDIENLIPGDKFKSLEKFISLCKERVFKYSKIQTEQSIRLGYFMDWDNSYHTSSPKNNYTIWKFLKIVNEKGWLYKGHDSVPWCPRCGTAISQHEILTEEYKELTHESIFFKLPIKGKKDEFLLVWTTTPWTIPSNVAVAVNPEENYTYYKLNGEKLWIMEKRVGNLEKEEILQGGEKNPGKLKGSKLIGWEYDAPFDNLPLVKKTLSNYSHRVIDGGEVVTDEEGTGLLHVAPGAGEEDFKLGKENKLPVISSIEEDASYMQGMGQFSGLNAKWKPEIIIDYLKTTENGKFLLSTQMYKHRYPTCWRCKTELVWRVVDEWYIAMDKSNKKEKSYRKQMVDVAKKIEWMPDWGLDRELDWLKNMHDWLISKKRYWGLALPIWECKKCGNFEVIGSEKELSEKAVEGYDKFKGHSPHRPWIDLVKVKCSKCGETLSRIPDVGNPWLDAGIVPFSTMPQDWFPADFITESFPGQFKNWFYSLIAMSTAIAETNPFKRVLGFASVTDEKGEEMHKSKGNMIEFNEAADKIGVDVMRWMYLKQNPQYNLNFGFHVADEVRRLFILRLWNVYSFFVTYANLNEWSPKAKNIKLKNILDKWVVSRFNETILNAEKCITQYESDKAVSEIENFVINDLSNWYVRRSRDRVAIYSEDENDKNECLYTLWFLLSEISKLLAAFIPFISEEIFKNLTKEESVHLQEFPFFSKELIDNNLHKEMDAGRKLAEAILALRKEKNVKVRIPLKLVLYNAPEEIDEDVIEIVKKETNVYKLNYNKRSTDLTIAAKTDEDNLDLEFGKARDLIRKIQEKRKENGIKPDEKVKVTAEEWPEKFEDYIKTRAQVEELTKGPFNIS